MTTDEIVQALRICVHVPDNSGGDCYEMVSRLLLYQSLRNCQICSRAAEIWRLQKPGTVPEHGCNF